MNERAMTKGGEPRAVAIPVDRNVQALLSSGSIVSALTRAIGDEDRARQLILQVSQMIFDADRGKPEQYQIARCDPLSIASAVLTVARSGLALGQEIYLIPYKGRLTAQTGYLGEVRRIREATGGRAIVRCAIIRAGDVFENDFAAEVPITHKRNLQADFAAGKEEQRDKIGAWACVVENGRWHTPAIMSAQELEEHRRKYSNAPDSRSIWVSDPDSAWLKTVIRRAAKLVRGDLVRDEDDEQRDAELELNERLTKPGRTQPGPEAAYEAVAVATAVYAAPEEQETPK